MQVWSFGKVRVRGLFEAGVGGCEREPQAGLTPELLCSAYIPSSTSRSNGSTIPDEKDSFFRAENLKSKLVLTYLLAG